MQVPDTERLIGTYDGHYADWSGARTEAKIEIAIRDGGMDADTGEQFVEIVQRAELHANTHEVVSRVPEHAADRLITTFQSILSQ